jgi:hypothetical protein
LESFTVVGEGAQFGEHQIYLQYSFQARPIK